MFSQRPQPRGVCNKSLSQEVQPQPCSLQHLSSAVQHQSLRPCIILPLLSHLPLLQPCSYFQLNLVIRTWTAYLCYCILVFFMVFFSPFGQPLNVTPVQVPEDDVTFHFKIYLKCDVREDASPCPLLCSMLQYSRLGMAIFLNHTLVGETGTTVGVSLAASSSQDTHPSVVQEDCRVAQGEL